VHEHSREAAIGQLSVENVEMVMGRVASLARTEMNDVRIWCICNLGKKLQSATGSLSLKLIIQRLDVIITHSLPPAVLHRFYR
jgi:hypothetical protein